MKLKFSLIVIICIMVIFLSDETLAQEDSIAGEPKENILLRLFPEDCMTIYHLPVNRELRARQDSIQSRFYVFTMASRKKPGLARIIFDKLAEARIPDTVRHILFHFDFTYTGKGDPYKPDITGSLNTDTLKGIFTKEIIDHITTEFIAPVLTAYVFNQPLNETCVSEYNRALFAGYDELLKIYENDRTILLEQFIIRQLKELQDSLNKEKSGLQSRFRELKNELAEKASVQGIDTSLIFGIHGLYGAPGVSKLCEEPQDSTFKKDANECEKLFMRMVTTDFYVEQKNFAIGKTTFLIKEGSLPFAHHIKLLLESENILPDRIIEKDQQEPVLTMIREFMNQHTLAEMKEKFSDK